MTPTQRNRGSVGRPNFGQGIRLGESRAPRPAVSGPHATGGWRAALTRLIRSALGLPV